MSAAPAARPETFGRPRFYYDFASPECWLAAERVNQELDTIAVWVPVRVAAQSAPGRDELADLERRAAAHGLPAPRLPAPPPEDLDVALLAATFAAASGRVVAFSLAALRQAFVAGRNLSEPDNVLIAAAACELHPKAVLKAIASRSIEERLNSSSAEAAERCVSALPAITVREHVFEGPTAVEQAAHAS